jgi:ADP-heptose:LPS heptosyltransferase
MMHEVERGLDLVGAIGMSTEEVDLVLKVPDEAHLTIAQMLQERGVDRSRPLVVVHPGCSMPARTYPWEMYAEVVNLLVTRMDATVAITGASDEKTLIDNIMGRVSPGVRDSILTFPGTLPFAEFCALIEMADLTVTNNTGPMHIAAAVKTPVIALFALTNPPEQWGPWRVPHRQLYQDVSCRICYSRICPYGHECLRLVTPEMVVEAATRLLLEVCTGNCSDFRAQTVPLISNRRGNVV